MNWLVYIGGGWITLCFSMWFVRQMFDGSPENWERTIAIMAIAEILSFLSVWIWICWRFIKIN